MPLYDYQCPECGLEFEVSRPMAESSNPANCPLDGAQAKRTFGNAPMTFVQRRGPSEPPSTGGGARWSHHGHSHGPGAGSHTH